MIFINFSIKYHIRYLLTLSGINISRKIYCARAEARLGVPPPASGGTLALTPGNAEAVGLGVSTGESPGDGISSTRRVTPVNRNRSTGNLACGIGGEIGDQRRDFFGSRDTAGRTFLVACGDCG